MRSVRSPDEIRRHWKNSSGRTPKQSAPDSTEAGQSTRRPLLPPAAVNGWNLNKEEFMLSQLCFFVSIVFSFIAWGIVADRYIWPELRLRQPAESLRPLLILHSFRFIGLAFLVPGVVSPDLPLAFARPAAYGDIIAAILALLSLLLLPSAAGVAVAWLFSVWGSADLFNAFYQANHAGLLAGQLGAAFFLPTVVVPLLLITHGLAFRILLQHQPEPAQCKK